MSQPGPSQPVNGQSIPKETPKPYTTPEGYVAPKMSELWLYANKTHPYYRYGYSLALGVGLIAGVYALSTKSGPALQQKRKT